MCLRSTLAPDDRHFDHGREMGIAMSISFGFSASPVFPLFGCVIVDQSLEEAREALFGKNDRRVAEVSARPPKRISVWECLRRYARSTPAFSIHHRTLCSCTLRALSIVPNIGRSATLSSLCGLCLFEKAGCDAVIVEQY